MSTMQPEDITRVTITDDNNHGEHSKGGAKGDDGKSKYAKFDAEKRRRVLFWTKVMVFSLGVVSCVLSRTVPSLRKASLGEVAVWRWCVLITALLAGFVLGQALRGSFTLLVEHNISMKENFIYYVVSTIETASVVLWVAIIYVAWTLVVDEPATNIPTLLMHEEKVKRKFSKTTHIVTLTLITIFLGSLLWLVKNILMMVGKTSFHIRRFFVRVRKTVQNHYTIETLFEDPTIRAPKTKILAIQVDDYGSMSPFCAAVISKLQKKQSSIRKTEGRDRKKMVRIDLEALKKVEEENVSCWAMKILIESILRGKPPSYVNDKREEEPIEEEDDAKIAADFLFSKVFPSGIFSCCKKNNKIIQDYFKKRQVEPQWLYELADTPQLDEGADQERIIREVFRKCMVRAWRYRRSLDRALVDNRQMFVDLNRFANVVLVIVVILIWLVMVRVEIRRAMVVVGTAIVGSAFIFGDYCKKILDDFAFVFVFHPFDVGDYCLIEDVQVIISRMHLLSTVALTLDNERRHYSNSTLCGLTIVNYTRSPSHVGDSVVFYLDLSTPKAQIDRLEKQIKSEIFKEEQHYWLTEYKLVMELESQDTTTKIKATLRFKHKTNFHELSERESRKSKLVLQLKTILDDLKLTTATPKVE